MGRASKSFYLAVFTLLNPSHAASHASQSRAYSPNECAINPKATVSDTCASYTTLDHLNDRISPLLNAVTQETDFFSYYRLNLFNGQCPFWSDDAGMCGNIACAVSTLDSEDDVPPVWRAEELSKLQGPKAGHPGRKLQQERPREKPLQGMLGEGVGETCVVEYDDECDQRDYCVPEDEGATAKGDYVSLLDNPERFTGYSGPGARHVWDAIYRENCFLKNTPQGQGKTQQQQQQQQQTPNRSGMMPMGLSGNQAAKDFRNVMERHDREAVVESAVRDEAYPLDDDCLEKRVFHRLISGMHASISTHLCWEYFNQKTGEWLPNVQCYKDRLHDHPERLSNLYFDFAVLVRAVSKLQKHLHSYPFCIDDPDQNIDTKQKVDRLTDAVAARAPIFDETTMFQDSVANGLKEDFRNRFRNVSRLMDCIGCDKCRLWGKLQVAGYGAALKILFEFDETKDGDNPPLRRTELVALINTLARVSASLHAVGKFENALESGTEAGRPSVTATVGPQKKSPEIPSNGGGGAAHQKPKPQDERKENMDHFSFPDFAGEADKEQKQKPKQTYSDAFWEEWYLVWRTYAYVLRSWAKIPRAAFQILVAEIGRLWNYWLGLPVPPRNWEIRIPSRDEL